MKKINLKVNNQRIETTLFYPKFIKNKNPGILFIHGWESSQQGYLHRARAIADLGAVGLTFSLRGHGQSDGKLEDFSRADHLQDVLTAYDFLVSQKGIDENKIGVVGTSYGGYLAAILSSKRKSRWLVLRAPALYQDEHFNAPTAMIEKGGRTYRQNKISPRKNKALQAISRFKGKLLIIKSENDEIIPEEMIQNYIQAVNLKHGWTLATIPGADHALTRVKYKKEFIKILKNYFKNEFKN